MKKLAFVLFLFSMIAYSMTSPQGVFVEDNQLENIISVDDVNNLVTVELSFENDMIQQKVSQKALIVERLKFEATIIETPRKDNFRYILIDNDFISPDKIPKNNDRIVLIKPLRGCSTSGGLAV